MSAAIPAKAAGKVKLPNAAEQAMIDHVRAELGKHTHVEIRALCPRRHYIAHVGIALDESDGLPFPVMRARGQAQQWDEALSHDGFVMDTTTGRWNVSLRCRNKRCKYATRMNYGKLATYLASAALDGRTEYVMPA